MKEKYINKIVVLLYECNCTELKAVFNALHEILKKEDCKKWKNTKKK